MWSALGIRKALYKLNVLLLLLLQLSVSWGVSFILSYFISSFLSEEANSGGIQNGHATPTVTSEEVHVDIESPAASLPEEASSEGGAGGGFFNQLRSLTIIRTSFVATIL